MKKLFDCGHKGKGKFCNRCRQELRKQREIEMNREARINRYKVIGRNPGDMPDTIASKAYEIWKQILEKGNIYHLKGWRKLTDSTLHEYVVFNVGKQWRLIVKVMKSTCEPLCTLSHQEYDKWLSKGCRR